MSLTQRLNNLLYALLAIAAILTALPPEVLNLVPAAWKPYVTGAILAAAWLKSHKNYFVNPDGSSALGAWFKPEQPK